MASRAIISQSAPNRKPRRSILASPLYAPQRRGLTLSSGDHRAMRTGQKGAPRHVTEVLRVNSRGPPALLPLLGTLESRLWPVGLQYIAAPDAIRSYQVDLALLASQGYTKIAAKTICRAGNKGDLSPIQYRICSTWCHRQ